ncbi:MAG TPA: MG2 domain-containing protein [Ideonella sp.]|uniref:alpha-2-macroglobulin family protein n=2 Tax=Ideonella sp. TaxID=1929293 RepID=UPI002CDF59D6|nr:MG2 domain-containing protein [Ideonella sp.]HSI52139.1 MG2 domain-containing protein [Ideonella sp.]
MSLAPFVMFRRVLAFVALASLLATPALSPAADEPPLPNFHSPFVGEPFFLLSDATFGSAEPAQVRLEINSPESLATSGGVDVVLYRVPDPLAFLQKQRNLHRIQVDNKPAGEGLANTLTHLWDSWVVKARLAWQKLFSGNARRAVTQQAPALKTPTTLTRPSNFEEPPQFKPLPGLPIASRFRYPVQLAKPILPPKDLKLAGSSSEFITPSQGNVFIPLGSQKPGLYLVEAMAGQHRATTLLFVSNTLALTKVSGEQMLVWATQRQAGQAVPGTQVVWTDGVGVLQSGKTDAQGLLRMARSAPEQTYVFGQDPSGGVFISENFYYDSEIYNAKVYATTDRPLYRPGDQVLLKVTGREFKNARDSVPVADGDIALTVRDPAGQVVATQTLAFNGNTGADGRFQLPDNAPAGGYELLMTLRGDSYTAAFRVADYQKPHFEIQWVPDKADFATGQPVSGVIQLAYPDGKPVANARLSLSARAQTLSMVEGELDYSGAFPLKLSQTELETDGGGKAKFSLPAAELPSRYTLTVLATDGAAYRVRSTRELLVERGSAGWLLQAERQFSTPGQNTAFRWSPSRRASDVAPVAPTQWEWLRLEDRQKASGKLDAAGTAAGGSVALNFPKPGSYTVTLRDANQRIVAASPHFVAGEGLKAPAGSIAIVFDKLRYAPGDTAEALVTFPEPVDQALLTLERERVEAAALLTQGGEGFSTQRLGATQWKLKVAVKETMSPNITVSVAYAKNGDSVFQNQGLSVVQPKVALAFRTDKPVYQPGETVNVEVSTTVAGQPVEAEVAVGVVDEMIYVLQPEIAPSIEDFYFHPRRNNVRTSVSLSFIGYDLATRALGELPGRRAEPQRAIKVLERPRRDNIDTAAWEPRLHTDATGKTRFSFKMPDSLTRWRFTGRAIAAATGLVGQQTAWVRSDKPFYAKWTSPDWQRVGDKAQASLALFNQGSSAQSVEWSAQGAGVAQQGSVTLQPGANFVNLPLNAEQYGAADLTITVKAGGKLVDTLAQPVKRLPLGWTSPRELVLDLAAGPAALQLPPDARNLRVTLATDPAAGAFSRWMDELVEYPYGCVEQTASRMLPLSIALQSLSAAQQPLAPMLTQRLATARLSLAQMAGPEAKFGWWGRGMAPDAFLTAYAYYADWRATQALRTTLPAEHWQRLLDVYAKDGAKLPPLQRALALSWMQEIGLPVNSMVDALLEELMTATDGKADAANGVASAARRGSVVMSEEAGGTRDLALLLAVQTAGSRATAPQRADADAAATRLAPSPSPFVQSLLVLAKKGGAAQAGALLAQVRGEQPTFDRAQALVWLHKALGGQPDLRADAGALPAPWVASKGSVGQPQWTLPAGAIRPPTVAATGAAKFAFVAFDSLDSGKAAPLPVGITRQLYRVVPQAKAKPAPAAAASGVAPEPVVDDGRMDVKLEAVKPGSTLDTNTLYLDVLTVKRNAGNGSLRWGVLDVALPPGAAVEATTWGLDLAGADGKVQPLERAIHQPTAQGYAVPVEQLNAGDSQVYRHLLRFSQRGHFVLPPARYYRMYEPEAKAVETGNAWAAVEVK